MTRDQARQEIKARYAEYLKPAKKRGTYICPIPGCGNGTGRDGDGITIDKSKPGYYLHCFKCGFHGDIIELYQKEHGCSVGEAFKGLYDFFGLQVEGDAPQQTPRPRPERQQPPAPREAPAPEPDFTAFFKEARRHIGETDYPQRRGLSTEIIARFGLGYCAEWRHPKAPASVPTSPRLIIPTSPHSYLARDTRQDVPGEQRKYSKSKAGSVHIMNLGAIHTADKPIFIVEGEIDALSIIEAGGEAVALGSTSNVGKMLEAVKENKPVQPLIIALDNDGGGERAAPELAEGLEGLKIPFYRINPAGEFKDANEALVKNRAALVSIVAAVNDAQDLGELVKELRRKEYIGKNSAAAHLQEFINGVAASADTPAIRTGLESLDTVLDGGFFPGLYVLGAISSLGKTSLALQIADNVAADGQDVLIISLEMARSELMAKSISRHTLQRVIETRGDVRNAKTTRGITTGARYSRYSDTERALIQAAIRDYAGYAGNVFILEGVGDIGAAQVRDAVRQHKEATGKTPVVIVDYLQILAPYNDRATDKQNTDKAVLELKRLSRDFMTPVIAISSLNRDNYSTKINMAAFKESGAVEYSADVLLGLQYTGAGETGFDAEAAATKDPREIELVILKNRNGRKGDVVKLEYYPMFNYFKDQGIEQRTPNGKTARRK